MSSSSNLFFSGAGCISSSPPESAAGNQLYTEMEALTLSRCDNPFVRHSQGRKKERNAEIIKRQG
jgi:hypothetical protein